MKRIQPDLIKVVPPALITVLLFLAIVSPAIRAEEPENSPFTLGDFHLECVRAFKIEPPEGWDESKAWMLLRATGLKVDGDDDFTRPARQKDVIHIATQLGIKLSANDESQPLTRKQTEAFLTRFQDYFRLPLRLPAPEDREADNPPPSDDSKDSQD
jgi:hypothetical protein